MAKNTNWMKYAGMAFQMLATLGVAFFIGYKLDGYLELSYPIFLLLLPLIAMGALFYQIIKDTNSKK